MMRNIESGIIYLSYFMGPYIFELNKYVRNRKECAFSKDMILYRKIKCTETEFYLYKLNLHHIICFPAFTSTSSEDTDYEIITAKDRSREDRLRNRAQDKLRRSREMRRKSVEKSKTAKKEKRELRRSR